MQPTKYPDINNLLNDLLSQIQKILGNKLTGFYLYGSLVWGDFDYDISDIDLLAALSSDLDDKEFTALEQMHKDFVNDHKEWDNRIEVQYLSSLGLKTYKTQSTKMAIISPGDPFHWTEVDMRWIMNWYFVQDYGVTLFGPDPKILIDPVSKEEFLQAVQDHARNWREYVKHTKKSRGYQSYAILTICRALCAYKTGEQVSKKQAADWAKKELPEYATLIDNALVWREEKVRKGEKGIDTGATYPETEKFVNLVIDKITL